MTVDPARLFSYQLTKTDLSRYAAGMRRDWYLAARLVWGLDDSVTPALEKRLFKAAKKQVKSPTGTSHHCPHCRRGFEHGDYVRVLVLLLLDEFRHPNKYRSKADYFAWFGCSGSTWYRSHKENHALLWSIMLNWLGEAHRFVRERQR